MNGDDGKQGNVGREHEAQSRLRRRDVRRAVAVVRAGEGQTSRRFFFDFLSLFWLL